ncbi:hypothetical protein LCGC14_0784340 [marine sediment metagenome]|uniref:Uncharacterized protein n=1 Tax=marine sediment metagenome TaxID=412755 RepID=A0A0F9PUQ4_9ZZZZ|nr:hypothetical protein [Phycisphaerae bacterium]
MRNVDPIDWWTLTHFVAGFVARKGGLTRNELIALVFIYELFERSDPPESGLNRVVDGIANVIGWELAG